MFSTAFTALITESNPMSHRNRTPKRGQTRREFMRALIVAGAVPLLSSPRLRRRQNPDSFDVLVIGAGAAGIAAARKLHDAGYSVAILEARDRIGGRVFTNYDLSQHPVELGAEYIEGENILTWDLLDQYGLHGDYPYEDENEYTHLHNRLLSYDEADNLDNIDLFDQLWDFAEEWVGGGKEDISLADLLVEYAGELDAPLTDEMRRLVNAEIAADNAADLDQLGAYGFAEASLDGDGEYDYHVVEGYSTLLDHLSEGLDIRKQTPVQRVTWGEGGVMVTAANDATFAADRLIITLPLGVLQAGDITFDPPLPDSKLGAINGLGAGQINKLILKFDDIFWPDDLAELATPLNTQDWWPPTWGRENPSPILTALFGGRAVQTADTMDDAAVIASGVRDLEQIFGMSDLSRRLQDAILMRWSRDPYTKSGYSYVPVGGAGLRDMLAEPINNVLYFAGEATNSVRPGMVHGAMESGFRAADEVMEG
jgi:monoamine oxidase